MKHQGMIHIHLVVSDLARSQKFYEQAFGLKEILRDEGDRMVFMQTPGTGEVVTLREEQTDRVGVCGGIDHFGFPLVDANDLDDAIREVEAAGGRLIERGTIGGGLPTAFVADPDGYRIQL